jgi:hypothetical protein
MSDEYGDYLFEYPYQGSRWGLTIRATSREDAQARFKALAWGEFKGGPCETLSAASPRGWFVPLIVWWRNMRTRQNAERAPRTRRGQ